jgi:hypothetical protein
MVAASAQVRASCMSDRLSFSVVAFAAQLRASSAYRRNSLASDMTAPSWLAVPLNYELAPMDRGRLFKIAHFCCGAQKKFRRGSDEVNRE